MDRSQLRRLSVVAALALAAVACGGSRSEVVAGEPTARATSTSVSPSSTGVPDGPVTTDRSASILPSVPLTDVQVGGTVDLATLVPAKQPVLLWFWAPH